MRIYHGSADIVEKPKYGIGKPYNDYGRGFYCTQDIALAKEWAVDENRDGYANHYDLDDSGLKMVDINSREYCLLHWITILLQNRRFELETPLSQEAYRYLTDNFNIDMSGVDVIKGYRADDSYFSFAQDFVNGQISVVQLSKAMRLGDLGEQIMLRSRKAFGALEFAGCEGVEAAEWFPKKRARDVAARNEYRKMSREGFRKGELYMIHIIEQEVKADDPRLQ